ncbi:MULTISPECIES: NUDIX hydrolase [Actinoalloteichus]|uniref:ADP-ribose pyrophosphatase n=1 Tax=Actinoalloteichus fjordicus TaxID=1612552 RepID=A0AAC9L7I0_9PSEU|nr:MULTISPECIES: NUDIX hydrolase [Actinoalloteichus]APU12251.1 ADP-ribose pyrophosphatase [Actinoalloteichus fjordicus]APU18203.1 ADP-ribose pyrophosphatase [Actinoalloteichus sp. GBA129-24]
MVDTPRHSVSVAGVVTRDDGKILVIRRADNGRWEPPGGVLELNETFETGVRREILEETGIEVTVNRLTGVYKNMTRGIVALVFHCTPTGTPTEDTDGEARSIAWMTADEITQTMTPAYAVRVTDAITQSTPQIRAHDGTFLIDATPS